MKTTLEDIEEKSDVVAVFKSIIARNAYWYDNRYELYQVLTGYELGIISQNLFVGDPNVAMAFVKSDRGKEFANYLVEKYKRISDGLV